MATEKMEFDLIINGEPAKATIKGVKREVDDLGTAGSKAASVFESNWLMTGAKVTAAFYTMKKAFDFAKEIDTLKTKLEVATGSADNAKNKFAELDAMGTKMGLSTEALVETYSSFRIAADLAGSSSENTEKIFKAVATASSAMKLSAEDTTGVFMALTQMLSKGTVSSEELRQQFGERIPGAMSIAAKAMNMTDEAFVKALESGQIMANDLLPKLADALQNKFAKGAETAADSLSASYNRLGNTFTNVKEIIYNSLEKTGIISFFSNAITKIDEFIDKIARATTSIREMSMTQRDVERLDIIKQIADKEEQIKNAFSFNVGRYQAELRALKSKLNLIDELNKKEKEAIKITEQPAKKTSAKSSGGSVDSWIAEKQKLELMMVTETSNAYQKQYETLESQRQADLAKYGDTVKKKALINQAYDAQVRTLQDKAMMDAEASYSKETDAMPAAFDAEFKNLGSSADDFAKQTEDAFNEIEESFKGLVSSSEEYKRNQAESFKTREMAISLIEDEKTRVLELANLEYDKNIAELNAKRQLNQISEESYTAQAGYLIQIRNKVIESQTDISQIMQSVAGTMQSSMTEFFNVTSKNFLNFKSLATNVLNAILQKMITMSIVNPMMTSFGFKMSAKGNVFDSGGMQRFAQGGVVASTTQFRFAGGAGIMGEKGAEAIMPLKRNANGDLGVAASGANNMKVQIINESGNKMEVSSTSVQQDTEGMILNVVINSVATNKMGMRDMLRGVK